MNRIKAPFAVSALFIMLIFAFAFTAQADTALQKNVNSGAAMDETKSLRAQNQQPEKAEEAAQRGEQEREQAQEEAEKKREETREAAEQRREEAGQKGEEYRPEAAKGKKQVGEQQGKAEKKMEKGKSRGKSGNKNKWEKEEPYERGKGKKEGHEHMPE